MLRLFFNLFSNKYKFIYFLIFSLLVNKLSQNILRIENSSFPKTLTLSNGNIILVSNISITFYNSFFNSTIKSYSLNEDESFHTISENFEIIIRQYPNDYVIICLKGYLKIFSQEGDEKFEKDLKNIFDNIIIYDLIPIKIKDNDLYYIIVYTNDFYIYLKYFLINIEAQIIEEINNKVYNLSDFIKADEYMINLSNIKCQLMSNETYTNQLICFYLSLSPSKFFSISFNIDDDLKPINNLYYYPSFNISIIKSICNENKSQSLICYYQYNSDVYCSIYDIKTNNISTPKKYISHIGIYNTDLELYYFQAKKQYVLFARGSDNNIGLFYFDKNFNEINKDELIIDLTNNYDLSSRHSVIYLPQYEKYAIISDTLYNGLNSSIRIMMTNIIKSKKNINNILRNIEENSNEENLIDNIIPKCNKDEGYYPVNYNLKNKMPNYKYKECFNEETKPINFFFNKETEEYEPCYETCRTCNYKGNATINNCTTCDFDGIFRPGENSTNCVKECKYRYYITPYGQYKCTKDKECTSEASLYIREKDKCINECKLDDTYIYQYNGECIKECPENKNPDNNNICVDINKETCSIDVNEYDIDSNLTTENLELIAKTFAKEYLYTNNHISLFKHELYLITLYKNKDCITDLGLNIPKIDFGNCIEIVKGQYNIENDLLILIIEKYIEGNSIILYSLYDPKTGDKLDTINLCNKEKITIEESIIMALNSTNINLDDLLKLTEQNINLFNTSSDFYNDICFHFESPNGKDITLRDRLLDYYPNITLCNEGCFCEGINLTSMMAICQCKFTEILSGNIFKENAFVSKISEEIIEIITLSNLEILKCYKDIFKYKYFIKNTGGFIILGVIFFQSICMIIFICKSVNKMRKYSFGLIEIYLRYINPKYSIKYREYIPEVIKQNPPIKNKDKEKDGYKIKYKKKHLSQKKISANALKLDSENEIKESDSKYISLYGHLSFKNLKDKEKKKSFDSNLEKNKNRVRNARALTIKGKDNLKELGLNGKIKEYMNEYLSTSENDMDYDDAIKNDKRKFCHFFWERAKVNTWIINIIFSNEKLKPRSIRILLFLLNIDLYFVINGLFFNEKYISEVYHNDKEEEFFDFLSRTNYNFFYASMVGALLEYMFNCFFVEEKKFQNLFRRQKDNEMRLRAEFSSIINTIKSRYIAFFATSYVVTLFSWYYITCFNNVYPNMKIEWIKSSITIILIMIFVYLGLALLETILRFLSFKCKSEKIFKFSKTITNCC